MHTEDIQRLNNIEQAAQNQHQIENIQNSLISNIKHNLKKITVDPSEQSNNKLERVLNYIINEKSSS
jgi:hypothetical protein